LNLSAEAGTTGFGGSLSWRFLDHLGVIGGADYLDFSLNRTYTGIPYSGNAHLWYQRAGLNVYPWRDSSFRISLGTYFNHSRFSGSAVSDGTFNVGGSTVPAGDSINLEYKQQPYNPYLTLGGNIYFDHRHHFSLGGEIGVYYPGNPRVSATTTPAGVVPPADLASYEDQVVSDLKKVPVWPILNLSLNYSF
jgi:hypothetical protein